MKFLSSFILLPLLLTAQIEEKPPIIPLPPIENSFLYTSIGVVAFPQSLIEYPRETEFSTRADISFGKRCFYKKHAWDGLIGLQGNGKYQKLYTKNSYLFYPKSGTGFYAGIGCSFGLVHSSFFPEIATPWIIGYQMKKNFVQMVFPSTQQLDFSYGFQF